MSAKAKHIMLEVNSLDTFYGKAQILFNLTLAVQAGEIVALIGRNGAGKTTAFKSIMNLVPAKSGKISFKHQSIYHLPSYKICKQGLGYTPEDRRIFTELTVMENLEAGKQPPRRDLKPWTPEKLFELFPNLAERRHQNGGTLSGGEQQMLTIARTLMGNPEMIILDEPFEGLAPMIVKQLARTIRKLKDQGVSVLLSEQNINVAKLICDRAYMIHRGSIHHESPIDTLSSDQHEKYCSI